MARTVVDPHAAQAEQTINKLLLLWNEICRQDDLQPSPRKDCLFKEMFDLMSARKVPKATVDLIMQNERINKVGHKLRRMLSVAESAREEEWAQQVVEVTDIFDANESHVDRGNVGLRHLLAYPHIDSYREIVQSEMFSIRCHLPNFSCRRIGMLGSGPLPITSVLAQSFWGPGCTVLNVDRDKPALELSELVSRKCQLNMEFLLADLAIDPPELGECDLVYIAGMVGGSLTEKRDIIAKIARKMRSGAVMVLRGTFDLGELVYGKLDIESGELMELMSLVARVRYISQLPREFHIVMVN